MYVLREEGSGFSPCLLSLNKTSYRSGQVVGAFQPFPFTIWFPAQPLLLGFPLHLELPPPKWSQCRFTFLLEILPLPGSLWPRGHNSLFMDLY